MTDEDIPQFEEGETYALNELPENVMDPSGNMEWVDDETLALATEDGQVVELWWSHVEVTDVKYLDSETGELYDDCSEVVESD